MFFADPAPPTLPASIPASRLLDDWLVRLASATNASSAFEVAASALEAIGLDRLIYLMKGEERSVPVAHSTMPSWWRDAYANEARAGSDPFLEHCCRQYAPTPTGVVFLDVYGSLDDDERDLIHAGAEAGLRAGVAIPIGLCGTRAVGGFNVGGAHSREALGAILAEYGESIRLGLLHTHMALAMLAPAPVCLTTRERDCLEWLARGDQLKQIAARLGIAYPTVELHLRNARRKLGAKTREQALATAMQRRLIDV